MHVFFSVWSVVFSQIFISKPNLFFIAHSSENISESSTSKIVIINSNAYIAHLFQSYRGEFLFEAYEKDYLTLKKIKENGTDLDYTPVFNKSDLAGIVLEQEFYTTRSYQWVTVYTYNFLKVKVTRVTEIFNDKYIF